MMFRVAGFDNLLSGQNDWCLAELSQIVPLGHVIRDGSWQFPGYQ